MTDKKPLVIIAGPTACGKTASSVLLAKKIGGEIISADSMQVYKYMDIGTAKIREEEKEGVPHYMIDEFMPDDEFNVKIFQEKTLEYMEKIYSRGHIPILVGGTGFYINSVVYNNNFMETEKDDGIRKQLEKEAEEFGAEYIYEKLKQVDKEYAENIHYNNVKKVIRALEFYMQTGKKLSEHNETQQKNESPYNYAFIILNMDRQKLYDRINLRVDLMLKDGLEEEVRKLLDMGYSKDLVSMQGLGYKEMVPYIEGKITLEEAAEEIKKRTRHFAKRQLTWFKHQTDDGFWLDITGKDSVYAAEKMFDYIKEKKLI